VGSYVLFYSLFATKVMACTFFLDKKGAKKSRRRIVRRLRLAEGGHFAWSLSVM